MNETEGRDQNPLTWMTSLSFEKELVRCKSDSIVVGGGGGGVAWQIHSPRTLCFHSYTKPATGQLQKEKKGLVYAKVPFF